MKYNSLGNSDLKVSAIGFGTMSLDVNNPKEFEQLLYEAFVNGVNYFDTADLYAKGLNEIAIGKAVRTFRKDIVLATKVGNRWRKDGLGWDWDVSASYIKQAVDESLFRLDTDYLDLYQIHGGTNQDNVEEIIGILEQLISVGKIRYYGISSIRPNVFTKYCSESNIISNMMQLSILDNKPEQYFSVFQDAGVSLIARGSLAQGLLLDKEAKDYLGFSREEIEKIKSQINLFCKDHGINTTSFALKYVLKNTVVSSSLIGIRTKEHLFDVLDAYNKLDSFSVDFEQFDFKKIIYKEHLI